MSRCTRVLIADNHPIFRQGLRQVIEDMAGHEVVGEAADAEACIAQAGLLEPDIVTLDLNMPGRSAFGAVEWIVGNLSQTFVVVVSMHADGAFVEKAAQSGAHGFVAKEDAGSELAQAFERCRTAFFMSSGAGRPERTLGAPDGTGEVGGPDLTSLTSAERGILRLVSEGLTSREIAEDRGISERTVQTHRNNICAKLGLRGANALLNFAVRHRDAIGGDRGGSDSRV